MTNCTDKVDSVDSTTQVDPDYGELLLPGSPIAPTLENDVSVESLVKIDKLTKELRKSAKTVDDAQARILVDNYFRVQRMRITFENQIRAIRQGVDHGPTNVLEFFVEQFSTMENEVRKALDIYGRNHPLGAWPRSIHGIGPVLCASLMAHIDIKVARTAGSIWRLAGLDPSVKWMSREKTIDAVSEIWTPKTQLTEETLARLNIFFGRKLGPEALKFTREEMCKKLARLPWNQSLKVTAFKISLSMVMHANTGKDKFSYGREVYHPRKLYEIEQNERGAYAEQARQILSSKNYGMDTKARAYYEQGKLPPGHIDSRGRRFCVKKFLSDMFSVWYWQTHNVAPPKPYAFAILDHVHMMDIPNRDVIGMPDFFPEYIKSSTYHPNSNKVTV